MNPQLKFIIGPCPDQDFKMLLGEEDISDKINVRSFKMELDGNHGPTIVQLEVYPKNIEILPDSVHICIVPDYRTGRFRVDAKKRVYLIPEEELAEFDRMMKRIEEMSPGSDNWYDLTAIHHDRFVQYELSEGPQSVRIL